MRWLQPRLCSDIWLVFFLNVGSINVSTEKINLALHDEHMRLVVQRGALSLSRAQFDSSDDYLVETTRLEAIIGLVRGLELESTSVSDINRKSFVRLTGILDTDTECDRGVQVAYLKGVVVTKGLVLVVLAKLVSVEEEEF